MQHLGLFRIRFAQKGLQFGLVPRMAPLGSSASLRKYCFFNALAWFRSVPMRPGSSFCNTLACFAFVLLRRGCNLAWFRAWLCLVPVWPGASLDSAWAWFRLVPVWFGWVPAWCQSLEHIRLARRGQDPLGLRNGVMSIFTKPSFRISDGAWTLSLLAIRFMRRLPKSCAGCRLCRCTLIQILSERPMGADCRLWQRRC